jgi:hypothetical protein
MKTRYSSCRPPDATWKASWRHFPYLKKFGASDRQLIYEFDFQGVRFIFLRTGKCDSRMLGKPTKFTINSLSSLVG